jgi:type IV secretory pathway TrbL component
MVTAEQLSSAVATPNSSSSSAEQVVVVTFRSGGNGASGVFTKVGGVASPVELTVIVCVQDTTRPTVSVAVQVITVTPTGNGSSKGK